jgi:hypothetical protein
MYADRLLFGHGEAEDLAARLHWVLGLSSPERIELGLYVRQRVLALHSLPGLADRLVELLLHMKSGQKT